MKYLVIGLAQFVGVAWIFDFATQEDSYYMSGDVSRWDHATNGGGASIAVVAAVVASAIASVFLITGLTRRRRSAQFAVLGIVAYLSSLYAAFFFLSIGH